MANVMLGFPNRGDAATLSGGAWQATLPRANLQDRALGKVARTTDAQLASTQFDIDLGAAKNIRTVGLVNHNLSLAARYRIRGDDAADFATPLYDSSWADVWPVVYPSESIEWEDDNWWTGKYTNEERAGYTTLLSHILSMNTVARYWRIELDDTANADGYVQIGRLFIGPAWQAETNFSYGDAGTWETKTSSQRALSGALVFQRRTPYRVFRLVLDWMKTDEAMARAFELTRRAGVDQEVLFIYDPDDTMHALRRRYLGHLRELSPIEHPHFNTHKLPLQIEEFL